MSCLSWLLGKELPHLVAESCCVKVAFVASVGSEQLSLNNARAQKCTQVRFFYPPQPRG